MRQDQIKKRFTDLLERFQTLPTNQIAVGHYTSSGPRPTGYATKPQEQAMRTWATEAEAAIAHVFPATHPNRLAWSQLTRNATFLTNLSDKLFGVFQGVANQVQAGYVDTLIDEVRRDSETDLLEQADALIQMNHLAAATVIAGGALETHLQHLVTKYELEMPPGHGSISAYNRAIATARKNGTQIYTKSDQDMVEGWGKLRNAAAHTPGSFSCSSDQIKLMVEGIRQFLARAH